MSNQFNFTFRNEEYVGELTQRGEYLLIYKGKECVYSVSPSHVQDLNWNYTPETLVIACMKAYKKAVDAQN